MLFIQVLLSLERLQVSNTGNTGKVPLAGITDGLWLGVKQSVMGMWNNIPISKIPPVWYLFLIGIIIILCIFWYIRNFYVVNKGDNKTDI